MFLVKTMRVIRCFESTCHQIPFVIRCGACRQHGNSTLRAFCVEASALKDRCTSAAECKYFKGVSHFPGVLEVCIVSGRLYMIPLPCRTYVYAIKLLKIDRLCASSFLLLWWRECLGCIFRVVRTRSYRHPSLLSCYRGS